MKRGWMRPLSMALVLLSGFVAGEMLWAQAQVQRGGEVTARIPIGRIGSSA